MPLACLDAICNVSSIGNMPKACPYVMMNRKLEIHILCVLWCVFLGVMWMAGGGKMIWGM